MQNSPGIHLSVVIPAYNEERRLPRTLESVLGYLGRQPYKAEIIIADDGSTDGTPQIAQACHSSAIPLRLVTHPDRCNHGKGAAVRRGVLEAQGQFRLFMDADNSTTIDHVERFWPYFDQGYDLVIGSRDVKGSVITSGQTWYRELAGKGGNLIIRTLAVPGVADTQAGFKMFTARCAEDIFPRLTIERWGFDVELLAIARHRHYRIKEVPITWENDPEGKVTMKSYFEVLGEVWRVRQNLRNGRYR